VIPASRQRNYLQSALYVVIAGLAAAVLLERLLTYAEAAEKAAMEATVSRLSSAMYARLAYLVLRGDAQAINDVERQSPFRVAHAVSPAYLGEFDRVPPEAEGGKWYFDRGLNELVYLPRLSRYLKGEPAGDAPAALRFRSVVIRTGANTYAGVALVPVTNWRWEPRP
jgi:hypothetical protein